MEHKRKAGRQGATKSRAGHWLRVSELHYASFRELKAGSSKGTNLSPSINLAFASGVSAHFAIASLLANTCEGSRVAGNAISNRELRLLEHLITYRKQTTAPRSNRELSTNRCHDISPSTLQRKNAFPLTTFSKCVLFALLIFAVVAAASPLAAQEKRKIIID